MVAVVFLVGLLVTAVSGLSVSEIVGTWSTKSRSVVTGPDVFDPVEDRLIEPKHTGISYSFTADGHYEVAYYRAVSNPTDPSCPKGIMQWQHGAYTLFANGSLVLDPIAVDGRQLLSDPCKKEISEYTRYNQTEFFQSSAVTTDAYHNESRLDLYAFNGAPMQPMYIMYNPPRMLPTNTLNPIREKGTKSKRQLVGDSGSSLLVQGEDLINPDRWWWFGVLVMSVGGIALYYS